MVQIQEDENKEKGTRIRCRKCLFQELTEDKLAKTIREYVERIDQDLKTPDRLYQQRLDTCRECESLLEGTCRVCGCFVEVRAAVNSNYCPAPRKKW